MTHCLVLSALGEDRPGIVDTLSKMILEHGGNIVDSRMLVLGGEFAIILMLSGDAATIASLESSLPALEKDLQLKLIVKRTAAHKTDADSAACRVEVIALDHPGIVYQLASFFSTQQINIENLRTERYSAAHTGSPMFALTMNLKIPDHIDYDTLREQFIEFCEELNLDARMEVVRS